LRAGMVDAIKLCQNVMVTPSKSSSLFPQPEVITIVIIIRKM
jgi:hypothetical protein